MWRSLAQTVIRYRIIFLLLMTATTAGMAFFAAKVKLSYEFSRAIPEDNPKYLEYQSFREKFGDDGNLMVLGVQSDKLFDAATSRRIETWIKKLRK